MQRVTVFNQMSLDGYVAGAGGDIGWFKDVARDPEWDAFIRGNAEGEGTLVFGRVTYEMMEGFWTTPDAARAMPDVAQRMNAARKIVFSRTLDRVTWSNATLVKQDPVKATRELKRAPGPGLVILGSASIAALLARAGLIDEYQVVVFPVALGRGTTMFAGLDHYLRLRLTATRTFGNGNVLLRYEPAA